MSHSDPRLGSAGFTLLEALVALAILAAITAVAVSALRGPSPTLQLDQAVSDLSRTVAQARARAVNTGEAVTLTLPQCDGPEETAVFFPDGTASSAPTCLSLDDLHRSLRLDPLSGRLLPGATQ